MARSIRWPLVVLLGGVLGGACSEAGAPDDEAEGSVRAQGFALLQKDRGGPHTSFAARASLHSLGARLSDLQADSIGDNAHNGLSDSDPDDGGWDWLLAPSATSHSGTASPDNLYGSIALAPWALLRAGAHGFRLSTTVLDAALGMQRNPQVDSPPDFVYLVLLSDLTDNAGFSALAKERYDARLASAGGARAFAERVRDQRHAQTYDGLIAYDLAWLTLGASALAAAFPGAGYDADANTYAQVVADDLTASTPLFDFRDPSEAFYTQGLSWSLVALSHDHSAPRLFSEARTRLLDAQLPEGAWGWNSASPAANLQATAEAVQALALSSGNHRSVRRSQQRAAHWLISQQAANGGWLYAADQESPFLDAEIGLALYLAETAVGSREGLDAEGAASTAQPLSAPSSAATAAPPLAEPLRL
ncbi:MAG TPA: hypothetical protein VG937_08270 [Polyangiaceae bacterium]|nr:hypothetical protein [Polyangiaceae bacterium]